MKVIYYLFALFIAIIFISCGVTDSENNAIQPGRRDYVWEVDTLNIPFTNLTRIWGSSSSDVWTIGPGGDKDKTIYRFNGKRWRNDGISRPLAPTAIWGSSANNVWIGGRGGDLWLFDGLSLKKHTTLIATDYSWISIENIWGDSENNIYAVGFAEQENKYKALLAKYDGSSWSIVNLPEIRNSFVKIYRGINSSNDYFIYGFRSEQLSIDTNKIYTWNGTTLKELVSAVQSVNIQKINNEMFIIQGNDLYKYKSNKLSFFTTIPNENFLHAIWGKSEKDIFFGMTDGIVHYNGDDFKYLVNFNQGISLTGAVLFNDEVFFMAYDFNKSLNLIFRGKLK
ncbi:MAG: hypothetical protein V1773_13420 [bacterium]